MAERNAASTFCRANVCQAWQTFAPSNRIGQIRSSNWFSTRFTPLPAWRLVDWTGICRLLQTPADRVFENRGNAVSILFELFVKINSIFVCSADIESGSIASPLANPTPFIRHANCGDRPLFRTLWCLMRVCAWTRAWGISALLPAFHRCSLFPFYLGVFCKVKVKRFTEDYLG